MVSFGKDKNKRDWTNVFKKQMQKFYLKVMFFKISEKVENVAQNFVSKFAAQNIQMPLNNKFLGVPPQLSGFILAYHPATPGLSPKHTIYTFIIIVNLCYISHAKRRKINKKRPDLAHFLKTINSYHRSLSSKLTKFIGPQQKIFK